MPLWLVIHPPGTFTDTASKAAFARDVTQVYTSIGLPAFYVGISFNEQSPTNLWIGGEAPNEETSKKSPFIRIAIDQIHINFANAVDHTGTLPEGVEARYKWWTDRLDVALKPHIADKGYDWEYHITETPRLLWKINGLAPPPWQSEQEKVWVKANRPVAPEETA